MPHPPPRGPDPGFAPASRAAPAPPEAALPAGRLAALSRFQSGLLQALARPAEQSRLFLAVAEECGALLAASCAVYVVEGEGDVLRGRVGTGELAGEEGALLPVEGSLEGLAALSGEAVRAAGLRGDPRAYRAAGRDLPDGPALAVPMAGARGAVGALLLAREAGETEFSDEDEACARAAARAAGAAVEAVLAFERARASREAVDAWRASRAAAAEGGRQLLRALRHEINNPLAAVLGHAQLLEGDPAVRELPHVLQSVRAIREEGMRMDVLTRRLAVLEQSGDPRLLDEHGFLRLPRDEAESNPSDAPDSTSAA